jgi:hypothetical protein
MPDTTLFNWSITEVSEGKFMASNGDTEVLVLSNMSGQVTNSAGEFIQFEDVRTLIEAGKVIEQALTDRYGSAK